MAEYSRRGAPPLCAECTALVDALLAPPPPEPGAEPPLRRLFEGTMSQLYERSHIAMLASADQRTAAFFWALSASSSRLELLRAHAAAKNR